MSASDSKSNKCKLECIDEGKNFCLSADGSQGICYDSSERYTKYDYCSFDNKLSPSRFKYWVCPNEAACGSREISVPYTGEVIIRSIDKWSQKFVLNDVCNYIIRSPSQMTEYDKMFMKIYNIEKADVYVIKGKQYFWLNHLDTMAYNGQ